MDVLFFIKIRLFCVRIDQNPLDLEVHLRGLFHTPTRPI